MANSAKSAKKSARQRAREDMRYEYRLMQRQQEREQQWSAQQAQQAQDFSAQQSAAQMAFQERMSNTAHQREVADLQAAGLNPVLAAGGSGASAPQGSSAEGQQPNYVSSIVSALPQLFDSMHEQAAALEAAAQAQKTSARSAHRYVIQSEKGIDDKNSVTGKPQNAFQEKQYAENQKNIAEKMEKDRYVKVSPHSSSSKYSQKFDENAFKRFQNSARQEINVWRKAWNKVFESGRFSMRGRFLPSTKEVNEAYRMIREYYNRRNSANDFYNQYQLRKRGLRY